MLPNSPLDQLRDIHPPADIGWWPLSLSWWILLVLGITILIALCLMFWRKRKNNAWRRSALIEIKQLKGTRGNTSSSVLATELNILIKRCIQSAPSNHQSGDRHALSSCEHQFVVLLNSATSNFMLPKDLIQILSSDIYKAECPDITANHLVSVEKWIKGLKNA